MTLLINGYTCKPVPLRARQLTSDTSIHAISPCSFSHISHAVLVSLLSPCLTLICICSPTRDLLFLTSVKTNIRVLANIPFFFSKRPIFRINLSWQNLNHFITPGRHGLLTDGTYCRQLAFPAFLCGLCLLSSSWSYFASQSIRYNPREFQHRLLRSRSLKAVWNA